MKIENLSSVKRGELRRVSALVTWEDSDLPCREIYFETSHNYFSEPSCNPDAFLLACALPAMRNREQRIFIDAEVCPE